MMLSKKIAIKSKKKFGTPIKILEKDNTIYFFVKIINLIPFLF